ncbi:MAG TPA: RimK family alpha-L-glutamate ligase [Gemmatimonadales bacterium]|nr:RimK family alpha-L-glutamate ligase [Gemmatimonadales bacterium]
MSATTRIAILTEEPGWHGAELRRALEARGAQVRFASLRACRLGLAGADPPVILPGAGEELPDGVMIRDVPGGTLEQVVLRLDVLHALREHGIPVYNDARAIERTVDKAMTSFLLRRAGLPTPPTCVTESPGEAAAFLAAETASGHEVVVKPLFGSLGVGLRRLGTGMALPGESEHGGVWYLQRYIDTGADGQGDRDLRVLVVGGASVAAMIRHGPGWVSNVAQGARCEPCPSDPELEAMAAAACAAVGADHAGVDLVRDGAGRLQVLEVNGIPAWRGLQGTTTVDIAGRVAADFLTRRMG